MKYNNIQKNGMIRLENNWKKEKKYLKLFKKILYANFIQMDQIKIIF